MRKFKIFLCVVLFVLQFAVGVFGQVYPGNFRPGKPYFDPSEDVMWVDYEGCTKEIFVLDTIDGSFNRYQSRGDTSYYLQRQNKFITTHWYYNTWVRDFFIDYYDWKETGECKIHSKELELNRNVTLPKEVVKILNKKYARDSAKFMYCHTMATLAYEEGLFEEAIDALYDYHHKTTLSTAWEKEQQRFYWYIKYMQSRHRKDVKTTEYLRKKFPKQYLKWDEHYYD